MKLRELWLFLFSIIFIFDLTITLTMFSMGLNVIEKNPIPKYFIEHNLMFIYSPIVWGVAYIIIRYMWSINKIYRFCFWLFLFSHTLICISNVFLFLSKT